MTAKENSVLIRYNLQFFDSGEKTEQPTSRKKSKAREEGQVAKSQEVGTAFLFLAAFFSLRYFAAGMIGKLMDLFYFNLAQIKDYQQIFTEGYLSKYFAFLFGQAILVSMPLFVVAMVIGLITNLAQVGWHPTTKPLKLKLSKLNPLKGFKRLFSFRSILTLFKSLAKFFIVIYVMYNMLKDEISKLLLLIDMPFMSGMEFIGNLAVDLGLKVGVLFLFIAAADFAYTKYKHNKDLKMSKQEVKDEHKNIEGDPRIKSKQKQRMMQASMRRMMQEVPSADVIITNPTHLAVAIKYDKSKSLAPIVVAKGADFLAQKIREKASENGIEIVENKPVARALYNAVDIGMEIPAELYQAVAEILAFVYKLKNKY